MLGPEDELKTEITNAVLASVATEIETRAGLRL